MIWRGYATRGYMRYLRLCFMFDNPTDGTWICVIKLGYRNPSTNGIITFGVMYSRPLPDDTSKRVP